MTNGRARSTEARWIRAQYAFAIVGSAAFWLAMGAVFGRMMRWW